MQTVILPQPAFVQNNTFDGIDAWHLEFALVQEVLADTLTKVIALDTEYSNLLYILRNRMNELVDSCPTSEKGSAHV